MVRLIRTRVGEFTLSESVSMDIIKQDEENAYLLMEKKLMTIEQLFQQKEKISLTEKQIKMFINGVKLPFSLPDEIYRIYQNEQFIGIGKIQTQYLKREIVLI